jgi:hypothetical protein
MMVSMMTPVMTQVKKKHRKEPNKSSFRTWRRGDPESSIFNAASYWISALAPFWVFAGVTSRNLSHLL